MVTKPEKKVYPPFGDVLSFEVAYLQAAHTIDVAVQLAVESGNIEELQHLALTWMELGNRLFNGSQDEDDDEEPTDDDDDPLRVVGFTRSMGKVEVAE